MQWEPPGLNGKFGEFNISTLEQKSVFVEVKNPGWEAELSVAEGQAGGQSSQNTEALASLSATGLPFKSASRRISSNQQELTEAFSDSLLRLQGDNRSFTAAMLSYGSLSEFARLVSQLEAKEISTVGILQALRCTS